MQSHCDGFTLEDGSTACPLTELLAIPSTPKLDEEEGSSFAMVLWPLFLRNVLLGVMMTRRRRLDLRLNEGTWGVFFPVVLRQCEIQREAKVVVRHDGSVLRGRLMASQRVVIDNQMLPRAEGLPGGWVAHAGWVKLQ